MTPSAARATSPSRGPNLLQNPGFEAGTTGWTLTGSARRDVSYPHYGDYEGMTTVSAATISQKVAAPAAGCYRLTAYVGTTVLSRISRTSGAALQLTSGATTQQVAIDPYTGYQRYELFIDAAAGQGLEVRLTTNVASDYYWPWLNDTYSIIDDV